MKQFYYESRKIFRTCVHKLCSTTIGSVKLRFLNEFTTSRYIRYTDYVSYRLQGRRKLRINERKLFVVRRVAR